MNYYVCGEKGDEQDISFFRGCGCRERHKHASVYVEQPGKKMITSPFWLPAFYL